MRTASVRAAAAGPDRRERKSIAGKEEGRGVMLFFFARLGAAGLLALGVSAIGQAQTPAEFYRGKTVEGNVNCFVSAGRGC